MLFRKTIMSIRFNNTLLYFRYTLNKQRKKQMNKPLNMPPIQKCQKQPTKNNDSMGIFSFQSNFDHFK